MYSFTVVIPTHRRPALLQTILSVLNTQALSLRVTLEVLIIYNHVDDIPESLPNHPGLAIKFLSSPNVIASKRNTGILASSSDFLSFIDDDCIPSNNFVQSILSLIPTLPQCIVYSGFAHFHESSNNYTLFRRQLLARRQRRIDNSGFIDAASAYSMNFLIYRPYLISTNLLFDESFTEYGWEDQYFFHRISTDGVAILQGNQSVVHSIEPLFRHIALRQNHLDAILILSIPFLVQMVLP